MSESVLVYDSDGVNPYGRELAELLARSGEEVTLVTARDVEWTPGVSTKRILPGNRGGIPRLLQGLLLGRGVAGLLLAALVRRQKCIVVWPRSAVEEFAIGVAGLLGGKVLLILHDPVARGRRSPLRARSAAFATRRAWRRVAHSEVLARQFREQLVNKDVRVCEFPPHAAWLRSMPGPAIESRAKARPVRFLMLGQVRPDKGYKDLVAIMRAVPAEVRARLELRLCGRGELPAPTLAALSDLLTLVDMTSREFVPDADIKRAVLESDVLLAPYVGASQSSTIAMALAAGLGVIAYDVGALRDLVDDDALVPAGHTSEVASRIASVVRGGRAGGPRRPLDQWRSEAAESWAAALSV